MIDAANAKIKTHNDTINNLTTERKQLTEQVWRYLIDVELAQDLTNYDGNRRALCKAIESIEGQIKEKRSSGQEKLRETQQLEQSVTSIQPTVAGINGLLESFGFRSFSLAPTADGIRYQVIREDGSCAKNTLSEGERTFVMFLYFYHALKGSMSATGTTANRVVVFDDPVSSLDSDILFVVSTLVRRLCDEVRAGDSALKQLFLLTHNVYFHKEVTFQPKGHVRYWTIGNVNGISQIQRHENNPVTSAYAMLWAELRRPVQDSLSIQNTLRRILENYFKIFGGLELDNICDSFTGKEQLACRSLLSWVNDGSHFACDDLFIFAGSDRD